MLQLSQRELEQLYFDPVMAAYVLLGAKLDPFQQARLRFMWWVPECIDSSGVGTGKTQVTFVYLALRCILIPDHWAAIYFPNFQIGKDTFWTKFGEFEESSPVFRSQFQSGTKKQDEDKANQRNPGAWIRTYKNGSKLFMPAPDFKGDSKNQASRDFNTVVIDDYLRAADQGDGIDKQLVDRARRWSYNKNHPIWCNHIKFLGHAESPSHKEYKRYLAYQRAFRKEGSDRHACYTFCYQDWSKEMAQKYREDNIISSQKRKLSRDQFRRQYLGIWTLDGENFYPEEAMKLCRKPKVVPRTRRIAETENFFLGQDTAQPTVARKSDYSAWACIRAIELADGRFANFDHNGRYFYLTAAYAYQARRKDAPELAAITHRQHQRFNYSGICLDPGGGGLFVLPELRKKRQRIGNVEMDVIGLTTPDDTLQTVRNPIVRVFKRGGPFDDLVDDFYMRGDEGFLEYWHMQMQELIHSRGLFWPPLARNIPKSIYESWTQEQRIAQTCLDIAQAQLANIRQLKRPDGAKLTNRRGYALFEVQKGKKDLAYAFIYAYARFRLWLHESMYEVSTSPQDCFG